MTGQTHDPPTLCAIPISQVLLILPETPLRLKLLQIMSTSYQALEQLTRLDPGTPEWANTLDAFLTRDLPAYINAQVATEVGKRLREERREVETEEDDGRHREERREVETEEDDGRHRWISGVAGVTSHTYQNGRRSKAYATIYGVWLSFIVDCLLLAILPSILSIFFFLGLLDHFSLSALCIIGILYLGFWRRSERRSEVAGDIVVLEELWRQGVYRQRLRVLWRARGLQIFYPYLATLLFGLLVLKVFGLVPEIHKFVADAAGSSFSPSYPFKNSTSAN
ncbi:hypothetical protein B9479_004517 [Cryptococcus floricola]|uniref:Uncharacterized protein n=1 Tax=Cryptococcus floricola TaxID=2591691 RepID=A0A5D3AYA5_9TREE|nr:hypothetical protein B9479_004517 [Cryptococcus floricola]